MFNLLKIKLRNAHAIGTQPIRCLVESLLDVLRASENFKLCRFIRKIGVLRASIGSKHMKAGKRKRSWSVSGRGANKEPAPNQGEQPFFVYLPTQLMRFCLEIQ